MVWQIEAAQSQALAKLAERRMQLQVTVQDDGFGGDHAEVVDDWRLRVQC
jgi:uncharacterized protein YaeQ